MHIHSLIYYRMGTSVVPDYVFDAWSERIKIMNRDHPKWSAESYRQDLFHDWDGATGMHLPADDYALTVAKALMMSRRRARALH